MRLERDWPAPGDRPQHSRNIPQLQPRTDSETTTTPAQEAGYPWEKRAATPASHFDPPGPHPGAHREVGDHEKALISGAFSGAKRIRTADLLGAIQAQPHASFRLVGRFLGFPGISPNTYPNSLQSLCRISRNAREHIFRVDPRLVYTTELPAHRHSPASELTHRCTGVHHLCIRIVRSTRVVGAIQAFQAFVAVNRDALVSMKRSSALSAKGSANRRHGGDPRLLGKRFKSASRSTPSSPPRSDATCSRSTPASRLR
jgi:hypothetical protein